MTLALLLIVPEDVALDDPQLDKLALPDTEYVGVTLVDTVLLIVTEVEPDVEGEPDTDTVLETDEDELNDTIKSLIGPDITIETITTDKALEVPFEGDLVDAMCAAIMVEDREAVPVPYVMSGGTDNKALAELGIIGYGFSPLKLDADFDFMALFHGVDERVPVEGLTFGVRVLKDFLEHA